MTHVTWRKSDAFNPDMQIDLLYFSFNPDRYFIEQLNRELFKVWFRLFKIPIVGEMHWNLVNV